MTIDQLQELVRDARWCAALGTGPEPGVLHIENADEWRKLIVECEAEEFGLEPQSPSRMPGFRWLSEDVQIRLPLPSAHIEIRKLVAASTRHLSSTWLVVDRADLTPAFRRAASHVFVGAAAESAAQQSGLWLIAARLFAKGRWPFGVSEKGELIVL